MATPSDAEIKAAIEAALGNLDLPAEVTTLVGTYLTSGGAVAEVTVDVS